MLHDLLEVDEHLESLIGGSFGPDLQGMGGVGTILRAGSIHKGVGVATDRRIIFLDQGIVATEVVEMPYTSIESISYSTGMAFGGLKISGRGTTSLRIEAVKPKSSAKAFADVVRSHLAPPARPSNDTRNSPIDDLSKLAVLLEKGLVTREEFDAKKAQILGTPEN